MGDVRADTHSVTAETGGWHKAFQSASLKSLTQTFGTPSHPCEESGSQLLNPVPIL